MKNKWGSVTWGVALAMLGSCASKEVEFRDFATLTNGDLVALKAELSKPKPGKLTLHSGQTAQCSAKVCYVNWVGRNVTLHVEDEAKGNLKIPKGNFTLENEELDDLLARVAAAAEANEDMLGRVGNLGHLCSAAGCKLSVFVPAEGDDDGMSARMIQKGLKKGKVFRPTPNE